MAQKIAIGVISALAASASLAPSKFAAADGPFTFSGFSTSPSASIPQQQGSTPPASESGKEPSVAGEESDAPPRIRNNNPRTTSAGFDPEALERGAKALKGINNSAHAKKVFESIKTREETRQAEFTAKAQEFKAMQSQAEAVSLKLSIFVF
jgi:ATPase family AAA domain-containing protein 3A/B